MLQVNVELKERGYPITIGEGLLKNPNSYSPLKAGDKVMIVSNPTVAEYYLSLVTEALTKLGCKVDSVLIPDGEEHKTLDSLNLIFTALLEKITTVIAL